MELLRLTALCAVCLVPVVLLRKKTPEHALLLTVAVLLLAVEWCIRLAAPVAVELGALFRQAGLETAHGEILLKTVAASAAARLGADLCRDGGSQALASAVELAGSVAVLLIAMPLLREAAALLLGFFT